MTAKYIIGGVIVILFMIWGASAFLNTTIQYVSIDKAKASNKMVQVMGKIDFDTKNMMLKNHNSNLLFMMPKRKQLLVHLL